MNGKWLILRTGLDAITKESWKYYRPNENAEITKEFKKAMFRLFRNIMNVKLVEADMMLEAKEVEPGNIDVFCEDIYGNDYSLHFIKWEEVLAFEVFETTKNRIGQARLAAAFLYEIAWFGISDYENTKAIKEFEKDIEEIPLK